MVSWSNLPHVLLPHIFQYLSTSTILHSVTLVNKSWSTQSKHTLCWCNNVLYINNLSNDMLLLDWLDNNISSSLYGLHISRTLNLQLTINLIERYSSLQYLRIATPIVCDYKEWTINDDDCFQLQQLYSLQYIDLDTAWNITDVGISYITQCKSLHTLILRSPSQLTDISLQYISKLSGLHRLQLLLTSAGADNSRFTARGFCCLRQLKQLHSFTLWNCCCNDGVLEYIGGITSLTYLDLDGCDNISGEAYQYLSNMKLHELSLSRSQLTDTALLYIGKIYTLTRLKIIQNSQLTDIGISYLVNLTNLTNLNILRNTALTDQSIQCISGLTNIHTLDISGCSLLTDQSCIYLHNMTQLISLHMLACTNINDDAVDELRSKLPRLMKLRHRRSTHSRRGTITYNSNDSQIVM